MRRHYRPRRRGEQEKFSERFEREAKANGALNHPNIRSLHDVYDPVVPCGRSLDPARCLSHRNSTPQYAVSRTLTALPFDATGLKSTGEAFPVTENVAANPQAF
jgi:hypothetical protein